MTRLFIRNLFGCPHSLVSQNNGDHSPPPHPQQKREEKKKETKNEEKMTAKHQIKVLDDHKQRTDIICKAEVAKESVLTARTARETLGASKSSKISYFYTKYLLYWMVYQVTTAMFFYLVCKII